MRRLIGVVSAVLLAGGLAVIGPVLPAEATVTTVLTPSTWAYTDSRNPTQSFVDRQANTPVGSWRDDKGKHHKSRFYFRYDLTSLRGKTIVAANVFVVEAAVTDCNHQRSLELWRTESISGTTSWTNAPAEVEKQPAFNESSSCPSQYLKASVQAAIVEAVAHNQSSVTFELRVPADAEGNLHLGRSVWYFPKLSVLANTDPHAPTDIRIDNRPCDGTAPIFTTSTDSVGFARISDPDAGGGAASQDVTATFAVWPVDHPEDRLEWTSDKFPAPTFFTYRFPSGFIVDGKSYAMVVRANDDLTSSAWTPECRFTVDVTRPQRPPTISSTDYPSDGQAHIGVGIPGQFTFAANGATGVTGFVYGDQWTGTYIAADSNGTATATITPTNYGFNSLYVRSVDQAGNRSDATKYEFLVKATLPSIEDTNRNAWLGDSHRLVFHPALPDVVSYQYRVDDGPNQTIAADSAGRAEISLLPQPQGSTVYVKSFSANGFVSGENWLAVVSDGRPIVDYLYGKVGMPATFTFAPHMRGMTDYVYQFNRGQVDQQAPQTIAPGPDGTATVTFIPSRAGYNTLHVYSRAADGTQSLERSVNFQPQSVAPFVSSSAYPEQVTSGGVGIAGEFTFRPQQSNVVGYVYQFGTEPVVSAPAAADGTATITWAPSTYDEGASGWVELLVQSRSASGALSDARHYWVVVDGMVPGLDSPDFGDGPHVGKPLTLIFIANLPGSTEFRYQFGDGPEQTVAADGEGRATITWIPAAEGYLTFTLRSVTATGVRSAPFNGELYVYSAE